MNEKFKTLIELVKLYREEKVMSGSTLDNIMDGVNIGDIIKSNSYGDKKVIVSIEPRENFTKFWIKDLDRDTRLSYITNHSLQNMYTHVGNIVDIHEDLARIDELEEELARLKEKVGE